MTKHYLDKYRFIDDLQPPWCPECGGRMALRLPKPGKTWRPFWGCSRYPDCEGTKEPTILDDRYKQESLFE